MNQVQTNVAHENSIILTKSLSEILTKNAKSALSVYVFLVNKIVNYKLLLTL